MDVNFEAFNNKNNKTKVQMSKTASGGVHIVVTPAGESKKPIKVPVKSPYKSPGPAAMDVEPAKKQDEQSKQDEKPSLSIIEKEERRQAKRIKLWKSVIKCVRTFSDVYADFEDENIDETQFIKKASKQLRALALVELVLFKNPNKLEPDKIPKFERKLKRIRDAFQEPFEDKEDLRRYVMPMNKKDENNTWEYNYVTQEAVLTSEYEDEKNR
eukprot:UN04597